MEMRESEDDISCKMFSGMGPMNPDSTGSNISCCCLNVSGSIITYATLEHKSSRPPPPSRPMQILTFCTVFGSSSMRERDRSEAVIVKTLLGNINAVYYTPTGLHPGL